MKKAIFFHPYFSDGGVERTNLGLARGLMENGYKVTFLTTSYTNHFMKEISELNIEFISFGDKKVSSSVFDIVKFLNSISSDSQIYFISCQYYVNIFSMIASLFVRNRQNIKFINSERNHLDEFKTNKGFKNFMLPYLVKISYKFADKIIANSKETALDLKKYIGHEVLYAYNPTINKRIDELKDEEIDEPWFLNDNRKTIIGIGRFTKQKDFETLIQAFNLFTNKKEYKLVILGDGEDRDALERLINKLNLQNDVYLPGFVKNPYKFLKKSSLFVLSSRYEGLPNVLIEALSLNVLSISTNCKSGPAEILLNEKLLINMGDYKDMAKKMEYILDNPEDVSHLYNDVFDGLERFTYKNSIQNFIKVIEK